MGIFRTYLTKNNTITKNSIVNTAFNPVMELQYGAAEISGGTSFTGTGTYTRFLFDVSFSGITDLYTQKKIFPSQSISHILTMFNSAFFDTDVLGNPTADGRLRASSFDLVLFLIPTGTTWDQGTGYDFHIDSFIDTDPQSVKVGASNWYSSTTTTSWNQQGVYSASTTANTSYFPLKTQHFDVGNENINFDITNIVETIRTGGTLTSLDGKTTTVSSNNFNGFGIAYSSVTENLPEQRLFTVGFFSKYTNSYYEPFIQTSWVQSIKDDRADFYLDKSNKLFLYTHINKEPANLDSLPTSVVIKDNDDVVLSSITAITQVTKGVYSIDLEISSSAYPDVVNFTDTWNGLSIGGKTVKSFVGEFTLKENEYYNVGQESFNPDNFIFNVSGVRSGEKVQKGDNRKIAVDVRPYYTNDNVVIDNIYYRLYVRQGIQQIDIIPNTEIFRAFNQNYFYLDTSFLLAQDYYLDFTIVSNGEVLQKKDEFIRFTIVDDEVAQ